MNKGQETTIDAINVEQTYEVRAWCYMFGVSVSQLKEAMAIVGKSALKVQKYFKEKNINAAPSFG